MKREGNVFDAVVASENLRLAFWKASRGKRARPDQRAYAENLAEELEGLREGLLDGSYPVGRYVRFTIREPKERLICAAPFPERVLHHAIMNICEPLFERCLSPCTYACRKGLGQTAAVTAAQGWSRRRRFFLQWDFRKYFDSIPHDGLSTMLARHFKDGRLIAWMERIIATWTTPPESDLFGDGRARGFPIGNLTSQHLANLYLDPLDRLIQKSHGREKVGFARYMDDFAFWADERDALRRIRDEVSTLADSLGLAPKGFPEPRRTEDGMDWLGMRIKAGGTSLSRASRRRLVRKARGIVAALERGSIGERAAQARMTAIMSFAKRGGSRRWQRTVFSKLSDEGDQRRAPVASFAAATGTTTATTAALATPTGPVPPTPTTTTASAPSAAEHRSPVVAGCATPPREAVPALVQDFVADGGGTQTRKDRLRAQVGDPNAPGCGRFFLTFHQTEFNP